MIDKSLSDPNADPLAQERGSRKWTTRRWLLLFAGALGAAAFAFGAVYDGYGVLKGPPPAAEEGAARNADALTP